MDYGTLLDEPGLNVSTETTSHPTLIVLSGSRSGQCFRLEPGNHVLGRGWDADLFLDDESVSRKHAEFTVTREGQYYLRDLGSTNGTKVNGIPITGKPQRIFVGDRIRLSSTACVKLRVQDNTEEQMQQALYNMAIHDPLTGAFNKRYLAERIDQEVAFAWRRGRPLSLIILDLDRFKAVNDTHGHHVGDEVLREVARFIQGSLRLEDIFSRFGGEEFVVLMRDTDIEQAEQVAERLRCGIADLTIVSGELELKVTISVGIATTSATCASSMDLFSLADRRLYVAKNEGRNRVISRDDHAQITADDAQ
jgi:two-component system cell cycle response regulator